MSNPALPSGVGVFRGSVHYDIMNPPGTLSLVITGQGSPSSIKAQFAAGERLLGFGELTGTLSNDGRISASGQLMMGKSPFYCNLRGLIVGDKLNGYAMFVRTSGGRVMHSRFRLARS